MIKQTEEQLAIMDYDGNIIVSANAGTGKTATMIMKINQELKNENTYKSIGAITFTIKATKEIRERLNSKNHRIFVSTNNSFVLEEIIKPFLKDCIKDFEKEDFDTDYYHKFDNFKEGLENLKKELVIGSYKEIKANFIFELAIKIIEKSVACQKYLSAKYRMIFIDEYQDCDESMHDLFMKLNKKLGIKLFIIGDEKQSIYIWRNANPKLFDSVKEDSDFKVFPLTKNFRSTISIQNYSNVLNDETRKLCNKETAKGSVFIIIEPNEEMIYEKIAKTLDTTKQFAILRYSRANAKLAAEKLCKNDCRCTYIPMTPISEITTNSAWIYNAIANYLIISDYSEYDFILETPGLIEEDKKQVLEVKGLLKAIKLSFSKLEKEKIINDVEKLFDYLGYQKREEHLEKLMTTITEELYINAIKNKEEDNVSITFHSSKGLQYPQVILFAEDYKLDVKESIYNHYVACTRAKEILIIAMAKDKNASKVYLSNLVKILKECNLEVKDMFLEADKIRKS